MHDRYPQVDHEQAFERAWHDPAFTRFEVPPVDVNRVLAERYRSERPIAFTRAMLWDMETRKARRPDLYIRDVVEAGSADAWADATAADGAATFVRKSRQRLWLEPERYALILEQTRLDAAKQRVTFIGARAYPGPDGERLHAGDGQPIFHVVHGVGGEEDRPLNQWLIVFETAAQDSRLLAPFVRMAGDAYLPGYIEAYVRDQLGIGLERLG